MANLAVAQHVNQHPPAPARRLVVIDDHETFADLLSVGLRGETDLDCVGVAYNIDAGIAMVDELRPDMVVIDYMFAGDERNGVAAAAAIKLNHPDVQIVLLTGCSDASLIHRAATAGVGAVAPKDGSLPDLLGILRSPSGAGLVVAPAAAPVAGPSAAAARPPDGAVAPRARRAGHAGDGARRTRDLPATRYLPEHLPRLREDHAAQAGRTLPARGSRHRVAAGPLRWPRRRLTGSDARST